MQDKNGLFPKNPFLIRRKLRVAYPTASALLFYALDDTCIQKHCGYDVDLLEYLAAKLNMDIRQLLLFDSYHI